MSKPYMFLGHNMGYWLELERHAKELSVTHLITEIANLRAKLSFYESRIEEMDMMRKMEMD